MSPEAQVFRYKKLADDFDKGRKITNLCGTDLIYGGVQLIKAGGETHLHSHANLDGIWMVLSGRARFYGDNDRLLGEFGQYEGVLIPRGYKYWFETASDEEPLELLQIEASSVPVQSFFGGRSTNVVERADALVERIPG